MPQHIHEFGGVSVVAFVLLLSLAIDRLVNGLLFVFSLSQGWRNFCPAPADLSDPSERAAAERIQKTTYFVFAGLFSAIVLWLVGSGILHEVGFKEGPLDTFLTGLILMGGAERVSAFSESLGPSTSVAVSEPPTLSSPKINPANPKPSNTTPRTSSARVVSSRTLGRYNHTNTSPNMPMGILM